MIVSANRDRAEARKDAVIGVKINSTNRNGGICLIVEVRITEFMMMYYIHVAQGTGHGRSTQAIFASNH